MFGYAILFSMFNKSFYVIFFVMKGLIQMGYSIQCYACESCNDPFIVFNPSILRLLDNEGFNCTVNRKNLFFLIGEVF
jgi:hypothetical protein